MVACECSIVWLILKKKFHEVENDCWKSKCAREYFEEPFIIFVSDSDSEKVIMTRNEWYFIS